MDKIYTIIKFSFTALILLVYSDLFACQVDFQYDNSANDGTVVFTASSEYAYNPVYTWHLGDGDFATGSSISHVFSYSGEYTVCLTMSDDMDCSDVICYTISVNNINSNNCELNDCVYPGDTNQDDAANIYDIFSIGMHFGDSGPVRTNADEGWYGQPTQDWQINCISGNLKHTDCNGDGVINNADISPIEANYFNDHTFEPTPNTNPNAPEVLLEFSADSIVVNNDNPGLIDMSLDVIVGSADNPVYDIYALALSLDFLDDLIDSNSISIEYNTESFFCDPENVIFLSKTTEDGLVDIGLSRTNHIPVSGFGRIARVNFTIIGDIVLNRAPDSNELPLLAEIRGTFGINDSGLDLGFTSRGDIITFKIDESSSIKENVNPNLFAISPNPSEGLFQLEFDDYEINELKVYNATGKLLAEEYNIYNLHQLDLSHLPNGTYFVKVKNDNEFATKRIVISR